jgi:geranylgeranyl diphosphate synthase type II
VSYPDHLRDVVEEHLAGLRFVREPAADGLEEAMRYSLLAGGKRIRPVLALATAAAIGREPRTVLPLAAALELIHTYSLIHDDLPAMDDDDLRRGRPTCHVQYGEDVAILAGDALYAEAFRMVLHEQEGEPAAILRAVAELADATGANGMVGGQYIDVQGDVVDLRRMWNAYCCWRAPATHRLHSTPSVPSQLNWACCSRSSTTSSTSRGRTRTWGSRRARTSATESART